jgi:hypothetical protein
MTEEQRGPGPTGPSEWKISDHDRPVIELAVGAAVIDKLRKQKASFVDSYRLHGGTDPGTEAVLASYEDALGALDPEQSEGAIGGEWSQKFAEWAPSQKDLVRIQRAIGAARVARAAGEGPSSASEHYERLGGDNPTTRDVLSKVTAQ